MNRPDYIPADYKRIKVVGSLSKLFNEPFGGPDGVNCILYPRRLVGDFNALARQLGEVFKEGKGLDGMAQLVFTTENLRRIGERPAFTNVRREIGIILRDIKTIEMRKYSAVLRAIGGAGYGKKTDRNSVYGFHADGGPPDSNGRMLCCYNGPTTEILRNEDAVPGNRNRYHLSRRQGAKPFPVGIGDLWRQADTGNYAVTPPLIHRAPWQEKSRTPRLLLVAN